MEAKKMEEESRESDRESLETKKKKNSRGTIGSFDLL